MQASLYMVISHYDFLDSKLLRPWQLQRLNAVVLYCERTVLLISCSGTGDEGVGIAS